MPTFAKFKELPVNRQFRFASEFTMPYSGLKRGPWRKISPRKYVHVHEDMECHVGSINVEVQPTDETPA